MFISYIFIFCKMTVPIIPSLMGFIVVQSMLHNTLLLKLPWLPVVNLKIWELFFIQYSVLWETHIIDLQGLIVSLLTFRISKEINDQIGIYHIHCNFLLGELCLCQVVITSSTHLSMTCKILLQRILWELFPQWKLHLLLVTTFLLTPQMS